MLTPRAVNVEAALDLLALGLALRAQLDIFVFKQFGKLLIFLLRRLLAGQAFVPRLLAIGAVVSMAFGTLLSLILEFRIELNQAIAVGRRAPGHSWVSHHPLVHEELAVLHQHLLSNDF